MRLGEKAGSLAGRCGFRFSQTHAAEGDQTLISLPGPAPWYAFHGLQVGLIFPLN